MPGTVARADLPEPWLTIPNLVTGLRVCGSMCCFAIAAARSDSSWNLAGLIVYWVLDSLDGFLARALHQETRTGAQMDIIADRVLITFFYYNHLAGHPQLLVPIGLFLFEYVGPDLYLSIQFLRWPILSPNYFYRIDQRIWKLGNLVWPGQGVQYRSRDRAQSGAGRGPSDDSSVPCPDRSEDLFLGTPAQAAMAGGKVDLDQPRRGPHQLGSSSWRPRVWTACGATLRDAGGRPSVESRTPARTAGVPVPDRWGIARSHHDLR